MSTFKKGETAMIRKGGITQKHWNNIIKQSKHKKRSRLERERISEQIHRLDSSLDLTGLKNGELNSVLYKLKRGEE